MDDLLAWFFIGCVVFSAVDGFVSELFRTPKMDEEIVAKEFRMRSRASVESDFAA